MIRTDLLSWNTCYLMIIIKTPITCMYRLLWCCDHFFVLPSSSGLCMPHADQPVISTQFYSIMCDRTTYNQSSNSTLESIQNSTSCHALSITNTHITKQCVVFDFFFLFAAFMPSQLSFISCVRSSIASFCLLTLTSWFWIVATFVHV